MTATLLPSLLLLPLILTYVAAHGNMVVPYTWLDSEYQGWWQFPNEGGGGIGCGSIHGPDGEAGSSPRIGCLSQWFSNFTHQPGTTGPSQNGDTANHPWALPGLAPVFSSCGNAGGNPGGCPGAEKWGDTCTTGGYAYGSNMEDYEWPEAPTTEWPAGSVMEVAWYVAANHRGGYSYRLCPAGQPITEECFQAGHLQFVGETQWVVRGESEPGAPREAVKAVRRTENTLPKGSQWSEVTETLDEGWPGTLHAHIIDLVQVPELPPGQYVLSFRWDCHLTPQIWSSCANINIF